MFQVIAPVRGGKAGAGCHGLVHRAMAHAWSQGTIDFGCPECTNMSDDVHCSSPFMVRCNWSITSCVELWKCGISVEGQELKLICRHGCAFLKLWGTIIAKAMGIRLERDRVF